MSGVPLADRGVRRSSLPDALAVNTIHPGGFTVYVRDCVPVSYPTAAAARKVAGQLLGSPLILPNDATAYAVKAALTAGRPARPDAGTATRQGSRGPHMSAWPPLPERSAR